MLKIERMTEESHKKKRAVESEIMDTTSLQVNASSSLHSPFNDSSLSPLGRTR